MLNLGYFLKEENFKGVFIIMDNNMRIVSLNETFCNLQGYSMDELRGTLLTDLIVPEDKSNFFDMVYAKRSSNEMTVQMYHKNGAFRFFKFNMFVSKDYTVLLGESVKKEFKSYDYDSSLDMIFSSIEELDIEDITELVNGNDSDLATFMNIFPLDIWVKDRLGRYVYTNNVFSEHTGKTFDEVYLKDDHQIFSKEIANEFISSDNSAIRNRKRINYSFETDDASLKAAAEVTKIPLFNSHGKYVGIIGFSTDISMYKGVERKLKDKINDYESIINTMNKIIFKVDPEGNLTYLGGKIISDHNIDASNLLNRNILSAHKTMKEINEKINLVFQGKVVNITTSIMGPNVDFTLYPYKENGRTSIIGIGELVGDTNE